ncbi:MAG: cyclic pyranopterin monophosphate synthase MoaC, partial [Elusimicrobiota bacterium]
MKLSHFGRSGKIKMVDISDKEETARSSTAQCIILLQPDTVKLLKKKKLAKGDALTTAKVAGILAAKRVPELIPLTHPLKITHCEIEFAF